MSELVRYDAMCRAIDAAFAVDEVKAIHDKAAMLQAAARVAKNVEAETRAYEIRMRAARKAGELSKQIPKAQGGHNKKQTPGDAESARQSKTEILNDANISTQQASDWERLSEAPRDQFEAALATKSVRDLIDKPSPVDGDVMAEGRELARRVNDFSEIMAAVNAMIADKVEFVRLWKDASADEKHEIAERLGLSSGRLARDARRWARQTQDCAGYRVRVFGHIYNSLMGFDRERAP
jgi:hypothetical protein